MLWPLKRRTEKRPTPPSPGRLIQAREQLAAQQRLHQLARDTAEYRHGRPAR